MKNAYLRKKDADSRNSAEARVGRVLGIAKQPVKLERYEWGGMLKRKNLGCLVWLEKISLSLLEQLPCPTVV